MYYAALVCGALALAAAFLTLVSRPRRLVWVRTRNGRTSNNVHDARS